MAKNILIIEDDPDILDMMSYIVQDMGFSVVSSTAGVAVEEVRKISPVLILLDNRLADGFGHDLCRKLKEDPATAHFPVILVSAIQQLAQLAADSGADAYLNKPFDLEDLVAIVHKFTGPAGL